MMHHHFEHFTVRGTLDAGSSPRELALRDMGRGGFRWVGTSGRYQSALPPSVRWRFLSGSILLLNIPHNVSNNGALV